MDHLHRGRVVAAKTKSSTLKNSAVEACILSALKTWQFPPAEAVGDHQLSVHLQLGGLLQAASLEASVTGSPTVQDRLERTLLLLVCLLPSSRMRRPKSWRTRARSSRCRSGSTGCRASSRSASASLPLDAFYKGLTPQVGYTFHFSDSFAWQVGRGLHTYNVNTGLRNQLETQFGVMPTAFASASGWSGSDVMWTPIYGKTSLPQPSVVHFEVFGTSVARW